MVQKIIFISFFPIFIMLYLASNSANTIVGIIGISLLVLDALLILTMTGKGKKASNKKLAKN